MGDLITRQNDKAIVYADRIGTLHYAEGAEIHRPIVGGGDGIRLFWTRCGAMDIPANGAWEQRPQDQVTCPWCPTPQEPGR
jgi:hypothetical protein